MKGQPRPKRWKRLHVENIGDSSHKRCSHELQGLRAYRSLRDVDPGDRTTECLASGDLEKEAEGLQSSFCRLGAG